MAANTQPIFTLTPRVGWGTTAISAANAAKDGTGTVLSVFTAGAQGSYVSRIKFRPANATTVVNNATVARIFINNGSTNTTAANNILWDEITLSANTGTDTAALQNFEVPLNFALPAGYKINVTLGTAPGGGGYFVSVIGGDY